MYPQPPEYPPEYMPGNPWMPRVHNGFRYFLIALVVLTVGGYFTGNPYLVPNIFMSVFSQFQPHSATTPGTHTTDGTTIVHPDDADNDETSVNSTSPSASSNQMQSTNSVNSNAMNATGDSTVSSRIASDSSPASSSSARSTSNGPMTITTTVAPIPHDGSAQSNASSSNASSQAPVPSTSQSPSSASPRARRVMASLASDNPTVPDGWYTWPVQKRARYVRALMTRIDAP